MMAGVKICLKIYKRGVPLYQALKKEYASRNFYPSISSQIPLSNISFHTTGWIIKTEIKTRKCDINNRIKTSENNPAAQQKKIAGNTSKMSRSIFVKNAHHFI